jgi:cytochrome P450
MADIVSQELAAIGAGRAIPLQEFTNGVTRRVIVTLMFGELSEQTMRELLDAFDRAVAALHDKQSATLSSSSRAVRAATDRFEAAHADLDSILHGLLTRHRAARRSDSTILDGLTSGNALSDDEVICYLTTIMVSGQETTSASLAWALQHLARRPDITARLHAEMADDVDPADYPNLPYLQAVCMETLRHSSPVPNGSAQKVVNEFDAGGYTFHSGVEIVPCICVSHVDNFPHGEEFDPDRFVGQQYRSNEYIPFSVGTRYCPGSAMALQELAVALGMVVATPDVHVTMPDDEPEAVSIGPTVRVSGSVMIELGTQAVRREG